MTLDIFKEKGIPLDKQVFTWRELVQAPTSKLDDDAFTRVRIILMNGLESEAVRFSHATARMMNGEMRLPLAQVRRTLPGLRDGNYAGVDGSTKFTGTLPAGNADC
jgi:hypothetical protein